MFKQIIEFFLENAIKKSGFVINEWISNTWIDCTFIIYKTTHHIKISEDFSDIFFAFIIMRGILIQGLRSISRF